MQKKNLPSLSEHQSCSLFIMKKVPPSPPPPYHHLVPMQGFLYVKSPGDEVEPVPQVTGYPF